MGQHEGDARPTQQLPAGYTLGAVTLDEVSTMAGWAASEGWNPGRSDLGLAFDLEPEAFIALRHEGRLVGGGTIATFGPSYGFMGMFIVVPEHRGAGLGGVLWHHRLALLTSRLSDRATIGMDGVFAMTSFYERGGFRSSHRDLRFEGRVPVVAPSVGADVTVGAGADASVELIESIVRADEAEWKIPRAAFMRRWLTAPGVQLATLGGAESLLGVAVLRPCREGWRFGPVIAPDIDTTRALVSAVLRGREGDLVQFDTPEHNRSGLRLAAELGLVEAFGCARMYHGVMPPLPGQRAVGVASFEFG